MNFIGYVVGAVVLSLVLRVLRKKSAAFAAPSRIHLYLATAGGQHARDLLARKRDLDACGLKRIGTYRIDPLNVLATAFMNEPEGICAVVYHHSMVGCFVDMVAKNTTGKSFTATNAPTGGALDQREGHEKVFNKTLTIPALFELCKTRRPEGPYEMWNAENFADKFETAYAEEMDWRVRRGGVTRNEVLRQANEDGKPYTDEVIDEATRQLQARYAQSNREPRQG
jgi:hypothetical protein